MTSPLVEFLATDHSRQLWPVLREQFSSASTFDVATAFFTDAAALKELAKAEGGSGRLLISARFPTNAGALETIRDSGGTEVRAAGGSGPGSFHEKLFLARRANGVPLAAYLGSANWTQGGLRRNTEAGVLIKEPGLLSALSEHFDRSFKGAEALSEEHLASLREQHARQRSATPSKAKDRGRMRSRWRLASGKWILRQDGVSGDPFVEGRDSFRLCFGGRLTGGQTISRNPAVFANGQGMILTRIAQRKDGSPDRLIYGRGIVANLDPELSGLPTRYKSQLLQRFPSEMVEFICRWPNAVWLDPVEFVDYPHECETFLWASELLGVSHFQGGYQYMDEGQWSRSNEALDVATDHFGVAAVEPDGLWWNSYLGLEVHDPLYMTRQLLEELNRRQA